MRRYVLCPWLSRSVSCSLVAFRDAVPGVAAGLQSVMFISCRIVVRYSSERLISKCVPRFWMLRPRNETVCPIVRSPVGRRRRCCCMVLKMWLTVCCGPRKRRSST